MYKQSAYVLALFLGTSSATQVSQGFATGMNGDEDLGEDITMKGDKFHFAQNIQLSAEPEATQAAAASYPPPEKVHTLDPKIAKAHTTFYNKLGQQGYYRGDISEKGMDEDVHDFANKNVERLAWPRSEQAFVPNGSKVTFPAAPTPPSNFFARAGSDISEKGIDEDVHDFANKNVERLAWPRSEQAFVPNGSKVTFPPAPTPPSLYQRYRNNRDISEAKGAYTVAGEKVDGIDEEVHGLANSMVDRINWNRSKEPFVPNGSKWNFPASFYQRNGRDISEAKGAYTVAGEKVDGIDEEVHGLANSMVDRINWNRSKEPFVPNGSKVTFPASLYQHHNNQHSQDIANKEIRPDVWVTVHKMVDPVAHWRGKKAPKYDYEPWWGEDGAPPMAELKKPECPEEIEEQPNAMTKKLKKAAKKAKAKAKKEEEEMPGDIEEKKEKKEEKKDEEKKGDAKEDKKDDEKKDDEKKDDEKKDDEKKDDEKKDEKKEEKKEEKKLAQMPPHSALVFDSVNQLWRY